MQLSQMIQNAETAQSYTAAFAMLDIPREGIRMTGSAREMLTVFCELRAETRNTPTVRTTVAEGAGVAFEFAGHAVCMGYAGDDAELFVCPLISWGEYR